MTKKGLLFAVALVLAGCAGSPMQKAAIAADFEPTLSRSFVPTTTTIGQCTGAKCRIDLVIRMNGDKCEPRPADPSNELVKIRSDQLTVPPARPQVLLVWVMSDPSYLFRSGDGIKFKNGATQFSDGKPINSGHEFQWVDRMTEKDVVYNYTIQVTHPDGKTKCVYDPGLINDW